ncbi:autorepressor SdpR family transcription factor [Metallumcola ferriviriculae]|uniref:Autorepressor SdpR family transcription factor n=1 Tax=Metallumcola ferriviriculae TaxID=3039180 RepID=A0AAU0UK40_9FIRM|nr:autorepressor SdpR family transcription factor [Desulfitibacteraceae bacterium MK1]
MSPVNDTFKALADKSRRHIIRILHNGDMTAGEIAKEFSISKPSISHHLNILKQANLVSAEKQGQHIYYSLNTTVIQDLLGWIMDLTGEEGGNEHE